MRSFSRCQLWYGRDEPPAEVTALCAGPITVSLDGRDLRYLRSGDLELLRRLYVAVRDHNWNTIPGEITTCTRDIAGDRFTIRFDVRHRQRVVDFSWHGEITGRADGTVTYTMDGVANSEFRYNRIGFCVLHPPATSAGRPYRGVTPDGSVSGTLPLLIEPQVVADGAYPGGLFPAVSSLTIEAAERVSVRFDFEGDLFEMEDQRNWTDASFKTYCTPLALVWPREAKPGLRIRQQVTISVEDLREARPTLRARTDEPVRISIGREAGPAIPAIGLGMASHGQELSPREVGLLRRLRPAHLRTDLSPEDPRCERLLGQARQQAAALGSGLEVAVFLHEATDDLRRLAGMIREQDPILRILVFDAAKEATPPGLLRAAREQLRAAAPLAQFAGGTNASFCELNRNRLGIEDMDAVVYSITPQIHAFDETSIAETLQSQAETVRTALSFCNGRAIVVSPVTLKPRFNAVATGPEREPAPGELPPQVDPRQMSLFAAGWTAGSISSLARGGAASVTYYETTGWRGLMESDTSPSPPDLFPSEPGIVFPMYHVFADLAEWRGGNVVEFATSDPLAINGLAVRDQRGVHVLVANLTPRPRRVAVGCPGGRLVLTRRLNEDTARMAMSDPKAFRRTSERLAVTGDSLSLLMMPYEVVRLDMRP